MYQAEILAIQDCLSWIALNFEKERAIIIYCDSLSVVKSLNGTVAKGKLVQDTLSQMMGIHTLSHLEVRWIKGHNNNTGNEYADMLAKKGMVEARRLSYTLPFMPITSSEVKTRIHNTHVQIWNDSWMTNPSCQITKCFLPTVREDRRIATYSVEELQILTGVITGHGLFKRHLKNWIEIDLNNQLCSLCEEEFEDSWHIWNNCRSLESIRIEIRQQMARGMSLEVAIIRFTQTNQFKSLRVLNDNIIKGVLD